MKLVRPLSVTDAVLTDSNVYETVPTAYNGGTTYADGDIASVSGSANSHTVYESLQDSNTGKTPASSPLWWQAKGTVYGAYSSGTTYALADRVTDTTNHLIYESAQGSNTSHALTDTAWWTLVGASNKWAAFDGATGARTTWDGTVQFELTCSGRVDTVGLLNMTASSVNVTMMDGATEIHNEDYSLTSSDGIDSWYAWFFEPVARRSDLAITNLPINGDPVVTLTITGDDDVSVGEIALGQSITLGETQYGVTIQYIDYSKIEEDDFGVRQIIQRDYRKTMSAEVWIEKARTSYVYDILSSLRATPILAIASDDADYTATVQYGILREPSTRITYPSHSILDLEFEGL